MASSKTSNADTANGRDRLLSTATALLTSRGAANVGINEIISAAEVAKMTLYNNFASKEALVLAVYEQLVESILQKLRSMDTRGRSEEERLVDLIEQVEKDMSCDDARGCPFIHASFQDPEAWGPMYTLAQAYKRSLRDHLYSILDHDRSNRAELADQLLILLDGFTTESYLRGAPNPGKSTKRAALTLLRFSDHTD